MGGLVPRAVRVTLAAAVESQSEHPIATAIVLHARAQGAIFATPAEVRALPGLGVEGVECQGLGRQLGGRGALRDGRE